MLRARLGLHQRGKSNALVPAHGNLVVKPFLAAQLKIALFLDFPRNAVIRFGLSAGILCAVVKVVEIVRSDADDSHARLVKIRFVVIDDGGTDILGDSPIMRVRPLLRRRVDVVFETVDGSFPHILDDYFLTRRKIVVEGFEIAELRISFKVGITYVKNIYFRLALTESQTRAFAVIVVGFRFVVYFDDPRILSVEFFHQFAEHGNFVVVAVSPESNRRFPSGAGTNIAGRIQFDVPSAAVAAAGGKPRRYEKHREQQSRKFS